MRLDYKPIVHIEKVKPKKESADFVEIEEEVKKTMAEQKAILRCLSILSKIRMSFEVTE
jgi:hypothetical protein